MSRSITEYQVATDKPEPQMREEPEDEFIEPEDVPVKKLFSAKDNLW